MRWWSMAWQRLAWWWARRPVRVTGLHLFHDPIDGTLTLTVERGWHKCVVFAEYTGEPREWIDHYVSAAGIRIAALRPELEDCEALTRKDNAN